jgi:5,10-methylenetetrahydromethanopterin reductase
MRLSLSFGGYYAPARNYVDAAVQCEKAGLDSIWMTDVQTIDRDVYERLALCAVKTSKIRLGPAITNPLTRHPTITAAAIMTLDEISGGRANLGLGPGDGSVRRIGLKPATTAQLEAEIDVLRNLFAGNSADLGKGNTTSIRWKAGDIPIYMPATGPKMLELAGRVADGVIINVGTNANSVAHALERVRLGRARSTRRKFTTGAFCYFSIAENREEAINAARPYVVWFLRNATHLFGLSGLTKFKEQVDAAQGDYMRTDFIHAETWAESVEKASFVTDEAVRNFAIAGTPEDVVKQLKEKEKMGIDLFIARHTGEEDEWKRFLATYCESVVPSFA